jgi:hypothetical protein
MTNHEPNDEGPREATDISNLSAIQASSLIRHSSFHIRHFFRARIQD